LQIEDHHGGAVSSRLDARSRSREASCPIGPRRTTQHGSAVVETDSQTRCSDRASCNVLLRSTRRERLKAGLRVLHAPLRVDLLLILLGIGLAGFRPLRGAERLGLSIWRRLRPLSRRLMRFPAPLRPLALGALWGFLPCGLVYGASAVALMTSSAREGALFVTAFGLGTVPAVLGVGAFAAGIWGRLGRQNLRRVSALAVALCGVWTLVGPEFVRTVSHAHH
jgi:sulfite exporter TauE/SafE